MTTVPSQSTPSSILRIFDISLRYFFCNEPYAFWLKRIGVDDRYYTMFLDWIARQNENLYLEFDRLYGDMEPA